MSKLLHSLQIVVSFKSIEYHLHIDDIEEKKGQCVWNTAVKFMYERNIISPWSVGPLSTSVRRLCDWLFWAFQFKMPPGGKTATRASVSSKHPPLSRLVFLWLSYSEGLGPPPKQSRPCTKDHLGDFSHKLLTTQLTTQSIFYLSVGGWEFMVKALNAQIALVTMEPYPQNSLRLRHAILLSAAEMRRSFWLSLLWSAQVALWKEGDGERKGGVRVQTKGSHWDSLSVIKFVETQKELQSHSREHLEREIGGL